MARNTTDNEWQSLNVQICSRCNLKTSDAALFQAHHCKQRKQQITAGVSYSLDNAKFTCSLCRVELPETEFREHLECHVSVKPYICKYCRRDFATRDDVSEHLRSCHGHDEQRFVFKLCGKTKEIMQKAKNNGKEFYKPANLLLPNSNSVDATTSKTLTHMLTTVPLPSQKMVRAPTAGSSLPSTTSSTSSSIRKTVPKVSPVVSLGTHSHIVSQPNSNTVVSSARPQLSAEQRRYLLLVTTQPQSGSMPTPPANVLQTQAPSCLAPKLSNLATDFSWRLPGQISVPYISKNSPVILQGVQTRKPGIPIPSTALPNLVTQALHSTVSSVPQSITRPIRIVTNVPPSCVSQVINSSALTVPPVFHMNQAYLSSPSIQNGTEIQMASRVLSSLVHNVSASAVAPNTRTVVNQLTPAVCPIPVNQSLASAVIGSAEGGLSNNPVMSSDVSVNCQNPTENDANNIYKVSIQLFPNEVKSSVESDNVNVESPESVTVQENQKASSSTTEVEEANSSQAVIKSEESADVDTDGPMQIRIENIMSLSGCQEDFQHCVQNNAADIITNTESSSTDTGSNTTEHHLKTVESNTFSFLHVVKGYFLCLVCHMKWCADSDLFFKHIWEKHTHTADLSCCPTGYSQYCARLKAIVKIIYDKSQEPMSDEIRSYFTPKFSTETQNEDTHNTSAENNSSAPVSSIVESLQQISGSESSSMVSVRPRSVPRECEQISPAESVEHFSESSCSPQATLIQDQHKQIIENNQDSDSGILIAGNGLDQSTQAMQESVMQIEERPADRENASSVPEVRGDLDFSNESLQDITAIDLSSAAASIGHYKSNNKTNTYEDISDDDCVGGHNRGPGSVTHDLPEILYSDDLPLDLSKKTQTRKSHDSVTVSPLSATVVLTQTDRQSPESIGEPHDTITIAPLSVTETAPASSVTLTERLLPENIGNPHDSVAVTPLWVAETAVASFRTRAERMSNESIGMGDDDDNSLRCFYGCGVCFFTCPKALELEIHIQQIHPSDLEFPCTYCGFRCLSSKYLIQHMENHIKNDNRKTFSCSLLENSDKVAQFENNDMKFIIRMLKTSLSANSDSDAVFHFACNVCQSEFVDLDKLGEHLQESLLKVIGCKHCESYFRNSFSWQKHMAVEHVDLPRMYCIKRKLLCYDIKMHSIVPQQDSREEILCLPNTKRDAETTVQENQHDSTHHESQTTSGSTSYVLDKIETDTRNLIENSEVGNEAVELSEPQSRHEGEDARLATDGIQTTEHEQVSAIPKLFNLMKASATMKSVLMSAISLQAGKASDERVAIANTEPNIERRHSVAQERCVSQTCTTTINERRGSNYLDPRGLLGSVSSHGSNEVKEIVSEVATVRAAICGNDGLVQIENGNSKRVVHPALKTYTANNLTNISLNNENQCCQESVAEIQAGVQPSCPDGFAQAVSENMNSSPFITVIPRTDHCLNENSESYVLGKSEVVSGEVVSGINKYRVGLQVCSSSVGKSVVSKMVSDTDGNSHLGQATSVESQENNDGISGSSNDKVSYRQTGTSDCNSGPKDYYIRPRATSPATEVSDFDSTANLEQAEPRIILDVAEQHKLEYAETTCLPVPGADIGNRQEDEHSSAVLESSLRSDIDVHCLENGISNWVKDSEDQAISVTVNEKDNSHTVLLSHTSTSGRNENEEHIQTDVLLPCNIQLTDEAAETENSFISVSSITECPLSLPLENGQKLVKDVSMVDQDFECVHDSEIERNVVLNDTIINTIHHRTPTVNTVLKTGSNCSDNIPSPVTDSLGPDHDGSHDVDFSSNKDPACTLHVSDSDFVGNDKSLENSEDGTCDEIHYNKKNIVRREDGQLYFSSETSACAENAESRELHEVHVLNSPSHGDILVEENNNTVHVSEDQILIPSDVTESKGSYHSETNDLSEENSAEEDISNSDLRCQCGTLISCYMDFDGNHTEQAEKSPVAAITVKCVKCRLVSQESSHSDISTLNAPQAEAEVHTSSSSVLSFRDMTDEVSDAVRNTCSVQKLIDECGSGFINQFLQSLYNCIDGKFVCSYCKLNLDSLKKIHCHIFYCQGKVGVVYCSCCLYQGEDEADVLNHINYQHRKEDLYSILKYTCVRKSELIEMLHSGSVGGEAFMKMCTKIKLSQPEDDDGNATKDYTSSDQETEHVNFEIADSVTSKNSKSLSVKAVENCLRALKRKTPLSILENNAKISRLENVNSGDAISNAHPPGSSPIKQNVQLELSNVIKPCTMPSVRSDKRKSEANQNEVITSKLFRINSDKHICSEIKSHNKPEEPAKQLERHELVSQPSQDILSTDVSIPESAHFRCSVCPCFTSQSYTKLTQHIKSQHPQNKSARVCRIHSRTKQNAAGQSERVEDATLALKEAQKNVVAIPEVHNEKITAHKQTEIDSETNIGDPCTVVKSKSEDKQKECIISDSKHKNIVRKQQRDVSRQSLTKVQNSDITSDSKPHFKCSVCICLTSHSYTQIQQHVKSQHADDKSAKVNRINPECLPSAAEQFEESVSSKKVNDDLTNPDSKQYFKCSVCISLSSHSYTEMKQHIKLQHPHNTSAKICRVNCKSPHDVKKQKMGMYICIHPKCQFTCKWDFEQMKEHISRKHPYYSCGYCKAPYTMLALLHKHLRFVHRGMKPSVMDGTIGFDQLFKSVDIFPNGHSQSTVKDITSQTPAVHKRRSQPSLRDSATKCEAQASLNSASGQTAKNVSLNSATGQTDRNANLNLATGAKSSAFVTERHTSLCSSDVNVTSDQENPPANASKDEKSTNNGESQSKTQQCKLPHSKSESILEQIFKEVSPMPEHETRSAEKLTVTSKTAAVFNHGDPLLAKTDRNLFQTTVSISVPRLDLSAFLDSQASNSKVMSTLLQESNRKTEKLATSKNKMSRTVAKTIADTLRMPLTENLHTKKAVAQNATSSLSSQPAESKTCGSKVTEYQKSDEHSFSTQNKSLKMLLSQEKVSKCNVVKHLRPSVSPQHPVEIDNNVSLNSATDQTDKNAKLNTATGQTDRNVSLDSGQTAKNVSLNSTSGQTAKNVNFNSATGQSDRNASLNLAIGAKSSINKYQEYTSFGISHTPATGNRHGNVHEQFQEICSENAATCMSDAVLLDHTQTVASVIVTPRSFSKTQDEKHCGTWMASQLETTTAAEGDQRKEFEPRDLRTLCPENLNIQNGSKTESMCENTAVTNTEKALQKSVRSLSKSDYPFRCTLCSIILKCVKDIERHYISCHPEQDVQLTERKSGFIYSNSGKCLRWKDDKIPPTDSYLCSYCAFRNMKRSDVEDHSRSAHPEREVKVFSLCRPSANRHGASSKLTSKATASPQEAHRSNSPTPSSYLCNVCSDVQSSEFQFKLHLASHSCFKHTTQLTTGASSVCHTCGYVAKSNSDLAQHTGEHMSERRFKCFMCGHDSHNKNGVKIHIKSVHNKTVSDDIGVIDRDKLRNVYQRPRLVNIDPRVSLINPFRQHPNYLQQLVMRHGIKMLDLPGDICTDILAHEHDKYGEYFDINKFM